MKTIHLTFFGLALLLIGCAGEQTDKDKLKERRAKLKAQIDAIDSELAAFGTDETVYLPLVEIAEASMERFTHRISVQGTVETDKEVMLNAEMGGILERVNVREGQQVSAGQVLAVINADILNSNIRELETQLEFAVYALEKQDELRKRNLGTEFEYKQAVTQVNALQSQLATLKKQRDKSVIKAPFAGIVDQIFPKEGELTGPQQPLLRIVNNRDVRITADISERHLRTVQQGADVKVFVPTLQDTFNLKITNIGNYIHPTNRTFRVRADVTNNQLLLPNMLAQLIITDFTLDSALVIPSDAILKSQLNEDYIFVASPLPVEGNFEVRQVTIELISKYEGKSAVQILNGAVKPGEFVVTRGGRGITNGDIVRIQ
jgi:membrane fusion protein (multidrug efflux system)